MTNKYKDKTGNATEDNNGRVLKFTKERWIYPKSNYSQAFRGMGLNRKFIQPHHNVPSVFTFVFVQVSVAKIKLTKLESDLDPDIVFSECSG